MKKILCSFLVLALMILSGISTRAAYGAEEPPADEETIRNTIVVTGILEKADDLIRQEAYAEAEKLLEEAGREYADGRIAWKRRELEKKHWQRMSYVGYSANGEVLIRQEKEYDSDGNLLREYFGGDNYAYSGEFSYEYQYDENGNRTNSAKYGAEGKVLWQESRRYDSENHLVRKVESDGRETIVTEYHPDDGTRERRVYQASVEGIHPAKLQRYSADNMLLEEYEADEEGRLVPVMKAVYEDGLLLQVHRADESGSLAVREVYSYDEKGNLLEYTSYGGATGNYRSSRYSFDAEDREVSEEDMIYSDGELVYDLRTDYTYGDAGNLVFEKIECLVGEALGSTASYIYNEYSQLLREERKSENGSSYYADYTYDSTGILISMSEEFIEPNYNPESQAYQPYPHTVRTVYDTYGRMVEEHLESQATAYPSEHTIYTYHENGDRASTVTVDAEGTVVSSDVYQFDSNGFRVRWDWTYGDKSGYWLFSPDEYGNSIATRMYDSEGALEEVRFYVYRYTDF